MAKINFRKKGTAPERESITAEKAWYGSRNKKQRDQILLHTNPQSPFPVMNFLSKDPPPKGSINKIKINL